MITAEMKIEPGSLAVTVYAMLQYHVCGVVGNLSEPTQDVHCMAEGVEESRVKIDDVVAGEI